MATEPAPSRPSPDHVKKVRERLAKAIPDPQCEIDFEEPWHLLIGTILSAQSTDRMVNSVTPKLFARWPTPAALGDADQADVEIVVKSTGFFRNKARAIRQTSQAIAAEHGGEVPRDLDALVALPGVARKTANLVMGTAFGIPTGMIVDTHAGRVSRRLGLTTETNPVKVENDLCALFHKRSWIDLSHRLVLHGRYVCLAKVPRCELCPLNEICPSREAGGTGKWTDRARWEQRLVETRGDVDEPA